MARTPRRVEASLDFAFFQALWTFYRAHKGTIRTHYRELTRKFLDYNNPERNPKAFLRQPQFEALEVYIFLKEFMGNVPVHILFKDWYEQKGRFAERAAGGIAGDTGQVNLFDDLTGQQYAAVFQARKKT